MFFFNMCGPEYYIKEKVDLMVRRSVYYSCDSGKGQVIIHVAAVQGCSSLQYCTLLRNIRCNTGDL